MRARRARRAGTTLVEVMVAVVIFAGLSLTLLQTARLSKRSHEVLEGVADENRSLRSAAKDLVEALRLADPDLVTVTSLADSSSQVTLQLPLPGAGAIVWGVPARCFGAGGVDEVGWSVRYTVVTAGGERTLVRRVLDDGGAVRDEEVVLARVRPGNEDPPGFRLVRVGDVWELTLTVGENRRSEVIHVSSRN